MNQIPNQIPNHYFFVAAFADGSQILQDENDTSCINPQKSQFYDVLEKEKESMLVCFVLLGANKILGVDLRDGHFEIDGFPFFQHRPSEQPFTDFRIIYYRNVTCDFNIQEKVESGGSIGYMIGWQTTFKGKNIQKFIKTVEVIYGGTI